MAITLYQHTSSYKAGAIKCTTGSVLSCELKFKQEPISRFFLYGLSSAPVSSFSVAIPALSSEMIKKVFYPTSISYAVGLSSSENSTLTSIYINQTTRVTVNKLTGIVSLSSQTPGSYRFNYFTQVSAFGLSAITLSATVPVKFLSGAPITIPNWSLPRMTTVAISGKKTNLNTNNLFRLAYRLSAFSEFDKTIAMYNTRWSEYSLVLSREFEELTYSWKYILKNRAYEL